MSSSCKLRIVLWLSLVAVALLASGVAAYGVTADGDISDIRAFPGAVELDDPDGWTDEPILSSQIVGQPCSPNCVSPSGFNIGSVIVAYDRANHAYYIGMDVSPAPSDDPTFNNGSGAWDGDGDGNPDLLTNGKLPADGGSMDPAIRYEKPSGVYSDKYSVSVDVGNDGTDDLILSVEASVDTDYEPALKWTQLGVPEPCVNVVGGWWNGDYAGDGPDIEWIVTNVDCLGLDPCDYYRVLITAFADTDADTAEEEAPDLLFEFPQPFKLCKEDEKGNPIVGWTFTVNGKEYTTGDDGCVELSVDPQVTSLTICETVGTDYEMCGVMLDGTPLTPVEDPAGTWCVTVSAADAVCKTMTWCNELCRGVIMACKTDCAGKPLAGWIMTLTGPGISDSKPTGDDGCVVWSDLPVGNYTVCEETRPGWKPCDPMQNPCVNLVISCDTLEHEVTFENECRGEITACKTDCEGNLITDPAFTIVLYDDGGNEIARCDTVEGCCKFSDLPVGMYTVCEVLPAGWELCPEAAWCYVVTITCDDREHKVTFENECFANLRVCKLDCEGQPLAEDVDCDITVTPLDPPGPAITLPLEPGNCVTFKDLGPGIYTVTESCPPEWGLCPGEMPVKEVTIVCPRDAGQTIDVVFKNITGGPTRTPGYWFTHPDAMAVALAKDCPPYIASGYFLLPDCCMFDIAGANRVFWMGVRDLDPNNRRTLGMHIIAAMCNVCLLKTPAPMNIIGTGIGVFCDPCATALEIGEAIEPLDAFNNSGDGLEADILQGLHADPRTAKMLANAYGPITCVPECMP